MCLHIRNRKILCFLKWREFWGYKMCSWFSRDLAVLKTTWQILQCLAIFELWELTNKVSSSLEHSIFYLISQAFKIEYLHDFHCDLLETVDITVDISLKIWHTPAPINKEESNWQEYLQHCPGEIAPVTNVTESEGLKKSFCNGFICWILDKNLKILNIIHPIKKNLMNILRKG